VWLRWAVLDDPDPVQPTEAMACGEQLRWVRLDEALPQCPGAPDSKLELAISVVSAHSGWPRRHLEFDEQLAREHVAVLLVVRQLHTPSVPLPSHSRCDRTTAPCLPHSPGARLEPVEVRHPITSRYFLRILRTGPFILDLLRVTSIRIAPHSGPVDLDVNALNLDGRADRTRCHDCLLSDQRLHLQGRRHNLRHARPSQRAPAHVFRLRGAFEASRFRLLPLNAVRLNDVKGPLPLTLDYRRRSRVRGA